MGCICCNNVFDLGCIGHCEPIVLPLDAGADGVYIADADFRGRWLEFRQQQLSGSAITFTPAGLNENYRYLFKVTDPDGDPVIYTDAEGVEFDCFSIQTKYSYSETITLTPAP